MQPVKNVLFIIADQWRGDTLGALGHACVPTPHLDALARDGVTFRRHYAQASPCGPSRASILTGLYMCNHRQISNGTPLDARLPNLAQEAAATGLRPALFGYTDTPLDPGKRANPPPGYTVDIRDWVCPGFEAVTPFLIGDGYAAWRAWLVRHGYGLPDGGRALMWPPAEADPTDLTAPCLYQATHSDTAFLAGAAVDHIDATGGAPWFVHFSCLRPHPPMVAPRPYNTLVDPVSVPAPVRPDSIDAIREQHPLAHWLLESQDLREYFRQPTQAADVTEADDRQMRATYYGNCAEVDAQIGRMIDHLKQTGQYDNTLIVFTSDHGEQFGDNWIYGRRGYYDGHFHVPLIIRDPRPEAERCRGQAVDRFTESVDLMPTILDGIGRTPPDGLDGRSLLPFLTDGAPADWRRFAVWELDFRDLPGRATERALGLDSTQCSAVVIRDERYKYVHFAALPPVLFDLAADRGETRNLAANPDMAPVIADYAQAILTWRLSHERSGLTGWHQGYDGTFGPMPLHAE